ncbi:uncharacterized protein [Pempheris klunzingeri]|uniref:uncharacterized protein n=1 Tax=Pempheris klunzingeri TaxID=3127111 RepID=UPI00397F72BD
MSAELYSASGNNGTLQGTTAVVGGSKPLHRFIKGQPKIIGVTVLVMGSCFFIVSIALMENSSFLHIWTVIPPGFLLAVVFIICGILYIVTEHNPTKKTVTISLALSIVSILCSCWTILHICPSLVHNHYYRHYEFDDNTTENALWSSYHVDMGVAVEAIFLFYSIVGAIIFIVMSVFAGAALRSTKSQAIIMMTTTATETPAE